MDDRDKPGTSKEKTEKEKSSSSKDAKYDDPKPSTSSQAPNSPTGSQDSSANDALFEVSFHHLMRSSSYSHFSFESVSALCRNDGQ